MRMLQLNVLAVLAVSIGACGSGEPMMSDYAQNIDRHMGLLENEQLAHSTEIAEASDLMSIKRAENDHQRKMDDHMLRMDAVMREMMSCTDDRGAGPDGAPFARTMQEMHADRAAHSRAMHDAATLETARMEELRHQDGMRDRLAAMRGQMGTMMGQGSTYRCSQCRHCGM